MRSSGSFICVIVSLHRPHQVDRLSDAGAKFQLILFDDVYEQRAYTLGIHMSAPSWGSAECNGQHFTGGGRDVGGLKSSLAMNRDSGSLMPTDEPACTVAMEKDTLTAASWRRTASEVAV